MTEPLDYTKVGEAVYDPGEPVTDAPWPMPVSKPVPIDNDSTGESTLVCFEAYQVVGSLLVDLGEFDSEIGQKVLDNLSVARLVHDDVLPWPSLRRPSVWERFSSWLIRLRDAWRRG